MNELTSGPGTWRAGIDHLLRLLPDAIAELPAQERQRSATRVFICLGIAVFWVLRFETGSDLSVAQLVIVSLALAYGPLSFVYTRRPRGERSLRLHVLATLALDPLFLVAVLAIDPEHLAFLHPFVLYVIVRSGLRFGQPCMALSLWATILCTPLLLVSPFWRDNVELTAAFALMLVLIPLFFSPLLRQIQTARTVEQDRIRTAAIREAHTARSLFLAKVSHELRSPLQSLISNLDVLDLRHGRLMAHDAELVARMRRAATLLNTQLRDLLTLANGEAGRLVLRPEPFEAGALVEALAASAVDLAKAQGIKVDVDMPPEPVFVVADGSRIDQVVTNLVWNSIRHAGTASICVRLRHAVATSRLLIDVTDDGPGLPQEALALFSAGGPAAIETERSGEGSGLGLAIVHTLVKLMQGNIQVSSGPGIGTRFRLSIPVTPVAIEPTSTVEADHAARVLVIDDRRDVLDAIASVIDEFGYRCDRAGTVAHARQLLETNGYDAILFDLDLSESSGLELARQTRREAGPNQGARMVAISAEADAVEVGNAFDARLTKPIDRAALRRALFGSSMDFRPSQPGLWSEND